MVYSTKQLSQMSDAQLEEIDSLASKLELKKRQDRVNVFLALKSNWKPTNEN